MRILLTKISDQQHVLEIVRTDGSSETVEFVTREALFHEMLHYAVESSLPTQGGFWGTLASGKSMDDLNDRTGESIKENANTLYLVEGIVGVMSSVMHAILRSTVSLNGRDDRSGFGNIWLSPHDDPDGFHGLPGERWDPR